MKFSETGLHADVVRAVEEKGYESPTPIQAQAIPVILEGKDVIGSAQTGTGKTAAFALPTLSLLGSHGALRCLVLVPTRELAYQVHENFDIYGKLLGIKCAVIYGGVGYGKQLKQLEAGADVVIATPGRLLDFHGQKLIDLSKVQIAIMDEVDRMLDMGFIDDVRRIVNLLPKKRQTLLFSATVPDAIKRISDWALTDPVTVNVGQRRSAAETVDHCLYPIDSIQKIDLLVALLKSVEMKSTIIFTRTKRDADRISEWLVAHDQKVTTMHADRSQKERERALKGFKDGTFEIMVATDVASRGLDISGVTHVINFNVPEHCEDYVHRIGRTGRASTTGEAFTLYSNEEYSALTNIETYIEQTIPRKKLEGFNYRREPDLGKAAEKPKRRRRNMGGGSRRGFH